jgi:hypothetical protein
VWSRWAVWRTGWSGASGGQADAARSDLFRSKLFRFGISQQMLQQIALGRLMIALPIYLQMVLEYNAMAAGLSLAPLSLSMFRPRAPGRQDVPGHDGPSSIIRIGFALVTLGVVVIVPIVPRATSGWYCSFL